MADDDEMLVEQLNSFPMSADVRRIVALEEENARLRADLEAMKKWALDSDATNDTLRAENVELQGVFARQRAEMVRLLSKSLTDIT